jgi:hypothetical protein
MDLRGFDVLLVDTVAADVRIRQRDDLPAVAGVGEDFLVAGERGVEHHLAHGATGGADRDALEDRAVCKGEKCGGQNRQQEKWLRKSRTPSSAPKRRRRWGVGVADWAGSPVGNFAGVSLGCVVGG